MATFQPLSLGSDRWLPDDAQPSSSRGGRRTALGAGGGPSTSAGASGSGGSSSNAALLRSPPLSPRRHAQPLLGLALPPPRSLHSAAAGPSARRLRDPNARSAPLAHSRQLQQPAQRRQGAWAWLTNVLPNPSAAADEDEHTSLLGGGPRLRTGPGLRRTHMPREPSSTGLAAASQRPRPRWKDAFRPEARTVERWLDSFWRRWLVLAVAPSLLVWAWCAMPFPKTDPYDRNAPWCDPSSGTPDAPWCRTPQHGQHGQASTTDANFWFFLFFYYGIYVAVALIYITQLFSLYRLNWWPAALGAKTSYAIFWLLSLACGYVLHALRLDTPGGWLPGWGGGGGHDGRTPHHGNDGQNDNDDVQWQRKTLWVGLAFATMAMPAFVCLAGLRRSGRQNYRHSLTHTQKTFLERQLARRIPASYTRFLWFSGTIGLALVALLAGQGYASVYLSTLPHTGLDGTAYVMFWTINVNVLMLLSQWILEERVRSRALQFCFRYYYFMVYFIFYRNLFARLRSFDQFALVQLMSSFWVCIWYPFSMTSLCHRVVQCFNPDPKSWEEYVEGVGIAFYLRNLAQNTTMLAFLGWVSILHFGKNQHLYPFFAFDDARDPYNYQLTLLGSLAIWASELSSSWLARTLCLLCFDVDVTNLGLDEMRAHPELVTSVVWTSVHVLQDCLLFLIKLNFR